MDLTFITDNPAAASIADAAGVDRIMVDLETEGKAARQRGRDTRLSHHDPAAINIVRGALTRAELMVRVNPWGGGSPAEIDLAIDAGAGRLMLPMFTSAWQVEEFVGHVDGRARTCLLLETGPALARLHDIVAVPGIDEIHVGLNDLHIALDLDFMFEILSGGLLDFVGASCREHGIAFGFGGIGRLGHGDVPAELVLSEHVRLLSRHVLLSRDFNRCLDESSAAFDGAIAALRQEHGVLSLADPLVLQRNRERLAERVAAVVRERQAAPGRSGVDS